MQLKTDAIVLEIEKIAFGGSGIARAKDGTVCFVPYTIPGETVKAVPVKTKKNYHECRLLEVINPAAARIANICPLAGRGCPGCAYQHLSYTAEVAIKQQQLVEFMQTVPDFDAGVIMQPLASEQSLYYRNKLTLHTPPEQNETALGYIMADNYHVIDVPQCPLASPAINAKLEELRRTPGFFHTLRHKMNVTFRDNESTGIIYWRNSPPSKISWLKESTEFGVISVPAGSFFQINHSGRDALLRTVYNWLKTSTPRLLIDLYCGCGIFSVVAAQAGVQEIICLDADGAGIAAAEYNLRAVNHRLLTGTAEKMLPSLISTIDPSDALLIVDPPRTGIDRFSLKSIIASKIKDIIYISCAPDTLVRDLRHFSVSGYHITAVQLVDMFPRTGHFETIVRLQL